MVLEHHDHTFKRTHPLKGGHIDKYGVIYLGGAGGTGVLASAERASGWSAA